MGGDHLVYAGQIDELYEMAMDHQLVTADHHVFSINEVDMNGKVRTAFVTFGSSLIGRCIAETTFEKDNNLMVAAIARRGSRINEAPRKVVLQAGDTLLLVYPSHIKVDTSSLKNDLHFFDSDDIPNMGVGTLVSTVIMIAMVTLSALGVLPLLQCAFLAAAAMLLCRCCNLEQAMKAINWEIIMVFAGSISLGHSRRLRYQSDYRDDGRLFCGDVYHGIHLKHGSGSNVLPHHVSGCREAGVRTLHLPHCPDDQCKQQFRHAHRFTHSHVGLWPWRIPLQRLYAYRSADEHHHPRREYLHREYRLSVDAVAITRTNKKGGLTFGQLIFFW